MGQQEVIDILRKFKELGLVPIAKKIRLGVKSTHKNLNSLIKQGIVKRKLENKKEVFKRYDSKKKVIKRRFKYIYRLKS